MRHDPVPLTFISRSINFVKTYVESTILVHFSVAVSMKPCIVLVLDILFMHHDLVHFTYNVISPNAGAISTSAEFLYSKTGVKKGRHNIFLSFASTC